MKYIFYVKLKKSMLSFLIEKNVMNKYDYIYVYDSFSICPVEYEFIHPLERKSKPRAVYKKRFNDVDVDKKPQLLFQWIDL